MELRYLCLVCACLELPNQYEVIIFALMSTFSDIGTNGEWELLLFLGFVCLALLVPSSCYNIYLEGECVFLGGSTKMDSVFLSSTLFCVF